MDCKSLFDYKKTNLPEWVKKYPNTSKDKLSKYNDTRSVATLCSTVIQAVDYYLSLEKELVSGAVGRKGNIIIVEHISPSTVEVAAYYQKGSIFALVYDRTTETSSAYRVAPSAQNGVTILLAVFAAALSDEELKNEYRGYANTRGTNEDEAVEHLYVICDNLYRRIMSGDLPLDLDRSGTVYRLPMSDLKEGKLRAENTIVGQFSVMLEESAVTSEDAAEEGNDLSQYDFGRQLSDEESAMVPILTESYVMPKEVIMMCKHIAATRHNHAPVRNILLRGPAGTGKTQAARAVASVLKLPYCKLTCNANTEIFDLFGQLFPDTTEQQSAYHDIPVSAEQIANDPVEAYFALTGQLDEEITSDECLQVLIDRQAGAKKGDVQTYHYVESDLIRAMKCGWVIEIQEPTTITQPGVLVGLNSLLEQGGSVTLPNGQIVQRHPDCVVIMTTNASYEGCRGMNQSVIDRCNLILDMDELDEDAMFNRARAMTGYDNDRILHLMVGVVQKADEFLKGQCITDGVVGMRGLIDWVVSTQITGDPYKSALMTIISRATSDPSDRAALVDAVLAPIFGTRGEKNEK